MKLRSKEQVDETQWFDLLRVLYFLKTWYTAEEALEYLSLPHPLIDSDLTCLQLIMEGRVEEVVLTIKQMDEGVYI